MRGKQRKCAESFARRFGVGGELITGRLGRNKVFVMDSADAVHADYDCSGQRVKLIKVCYPDGKV